MIQIDLHFKKCFEPRWKEQACSRSRASIVVADAKDVAQCSLVDPIKCSSVNDSNVFKAWELLELVSISSDMDGSANRDKGKTFRGLRNTASRSNGDIILVHYSWRSYPRKHCVWAAIPALDNYNFLHWIPSGQNTEICCVFPQNLLTRSIGSYRKCFIITIATLHSTCKIGRFPFGTSFCSSIWMVALLIWLISHTSMFLIGSPGLKAIKALGGVICKAFLGMVLSVCVMWILLLQIALDPPPIALFWDDSDEDSQRALAVIANTDLAAKLAGDGGKVKASGTAQSCIFVWLDCLNSMTCFDIIQLLSRMYSFTDSLTRLTRGTVWHCLKLHMH